MQAYSRFEMVVEVCLHSDLHIAGVGRAAALIDRCIETDVRGRPIIPGTAFKGRVRAHYERLLQALGFDLKGCKPPDPATMCQDPANLCPVCSLFGSPVQQSRIEFSTLEPVSDTSDTLITRIGIGINRQLNTVAEGRLFFYEAAPCNELRVRGAVRRWATEQEVALLAGAMKLITHFGGQKARGLGRATVEIKSLYQLGDSGWHSVNLSTVLHTLREVAP